MFRKLLSLFRRDTEEIENSRKPLMKVQRPTNPDDSVNLHSGVKDFYLDPRVPRK